MKISSILYTFLFSAFILTACQNDDSDEIKPDDKNTVTIVFDHYVGNEKLALGSKSYKNAAGEDFTVSTLNFYVSNIALKKRDGTEVKFPDQYFLVKQSDASSLKLALKDVPAGDYVSLNYMIGVDSLRSVSDVSLRKGVLDIAGSGADMYWSWNSGYIFFKIEGSSNASAAPDKSYMYHVGGFGGYNAKTANNLRVITSDFGSSAATVRSGISPTVHIITDVSAVFSEGLKISSVNMIHSPAAAGPVANGYSKMFKVDHVHNDTAGGH